MRVLMHTRFPSKPAILSQEKDILFFESELFHPDFNRVVVKLDASEADLTVRLQPVEF